MSDFTIPVTCANCGGPTELVASSALQATPATESRAVLKCSSCRRQWVLVVHLRPGPHSDAGVRRQARARVDATV